MLRIISTFKNVCLPVFTQKRNNDKINLVSGTIEEGENNRRGRVRVDEVEVSDTHCCGISGDCNYDLCGKVAGGFLFFFIHSTIGLFHFSEVSRVVSDALYLYR